MDKIPPGLKAQILDRASRAAANPDWTPADFLDLAGRDAVDKTLPYRAMSAMIFGEPPPFDAVVEAVADLQSRLNAGQESLPSEHACSDRNSD